MIPSIGKSGRRINRSHHKTTTTRTRRKKSVLIIMIILILLIVPSIVAIVVYVKLVTKNPSDDVSTSKSKLLSILDRYRKDPFKASTDQVILLKTHKTGSTTLGGILFRWAKRHDKRACCEKPHVQSEKEIQEKVQRGERYDLFLNHYAMWHRPPQDISNIIKLLREMISSNAQIVSSVREPISHMISFYNFFIHETRREPKGSDLHDFIIRENKKFHNPLLSDFGVNSWDDALRILNTDLRDLTWILQDRYVESLVLLRRKFNWDMEDVLFMKPSYSSTKRKSSFRRYDGNIVEKTLDVKFMDPILKSEIEGVTNLDRAFYDAVRERWSSSFTNSNDFARECSDMRVAIDLLGHICSDAYVSPSSCLWYDFTDTQYEANMNMKWPGDPWL